MKYIKLEIDPKLLQTSEWSTFNPPIDATYPRLYKIADGNAKVYFSPTVHFWLSNISGVTLNVEEDTPKEIQSAPNPQFSESFILKLVAIANDSKLAKDLT